MCECLIVFFDEYIMLNECCYLEEVEVNCCVGNFWLLMKVIEEFKFKVCVVGLWNFFLL